MNKKIWLGIIALALLISSQPVSAQGDRSPRQLNTPGTTQTLVLPANAENAPVISLGSAVDPGTGELVEGYAIVHYRKGFAKGGGGGGGGSTCYGYMASGAKWKTIEPWIVNPTNLDGLTSAFVLTNLVSDIAKWEDAADGTVGNGNSVNILGEGSAVVDILVADEVVPDNLNEVYFGAISDPGTIAVTIVWGTFGGPPQQRKLVEWDMVFNTSYAWSASGEADKMDFENIATHELGHAMGLADLYTSACVNETMYGYADYGDTNKSTLNAGDIVGINKLY